MDENDKTLKELFAGLADESVPFNFESKIQRKIEAKIIKNNEAKELGLQVSLAIFGALMLSAALYFLNVYYFKIELENFKYLLTSGINFSGKVKSMFSGNDSLLWIVIGLNVVLLIFAERLISEKLSRKEKE
ncbi:MAG: hypothetical protein AB9833_10145 [Bacteroidales bacterium]